MVGLSSMDMGKFFVRTVSNFSRCKILQYSLLLSESVDCFRDEDLGSRDHHTE